MQSRVGLPRATAGATVVAAVALSVGCLIASGCTSSEPSTVYVLSVTDAGAGIGTVAASGAAASDGGQITCQSGQTQNCSAKYDGGARITLTATAGTNSVFAGWNGSCTGTSPSCMVTMSQAQAVTALFNVQQDILQVAVSGTGGGAVTSAPAGINCGNYSGAPTACADTLNQGGMATLTEAPQSGSQFGTWGGACSGTATTCVVNITQAQSVTATFTVIQLTAPLVSTLGLGGASQGQVQGLGLNYYIATFGVFPSSTGGINTTGDPYVGQIMLFAGNFAPAGWLLCDGSLVSISSNTALFSLLGTTYGGNGTSNFAVPDLRARVPLGVGTLANPSPAPQSPGVSLVPTISSIALGTTAQGQVQSVGVNYYMAVQGIFPSSSSGSNTAGFYVGELMLFAGNFAPGGWVLCDGSLLTISSNTAAFSILGTTYGGNGTTNFAVPDLRARAAMGAGTLTNPVTPPQSATQIPLVSPVALGGTAQGQIGVTGLNYYVAVQGVFPSSSGTGSSIAYVGEFLQFAGTFAPFGWSAANGALLNISTNTALFSILGTTYGGNGTSTFGLPDLRARVPMGSK